MNDNRFRFDGRPDGNLLRQAEAAAYLTRYSDTVPLDRATLRRLHEAGLPLSLGTAYFPREVHEDVHDLAAIDRLIDHALRQPFWQQG